MVGTLWQDVRQAVRGFGRDRGVALLALASLAVGIAANTTVFSVVQALEFPHLIYPSASRIVFLESNNNARNLKGMPTSAPDSADIAASATSLEHASLAADQSSIIALGDRRARVSGRRVGAAFFDVMQVPASAGRALRSDDVPGVIVVSDSMWKNELGSDTAIVGRVVRLDGGSATVVGVMPAGFDADADFWTPLDAAAVAAPRDDRQFTMFARLAPAASMADAERELDVISRRLAADHPATNRDWTTVPIALPRLHGRDSRGAFFMLQGAVAFVLLIVCANIANLQLARGSRRAREMALRLSLGATRARLIRQLLTESLLLAVAGGGVGVWLSMWGIQLAKTIGGFPSVIDPTLNLPVLAFTALVSMTTGVLCGLLPALRASNTSPEVALRADGARGSTGTRGRLRSALVALQIGAAVVLAACAALMAQTFDHRQRVDLGFDPSHAVRATVALGTTDAARLRNETTRLLAALNTTPAIASAGASTFALPTAAGAQRVITLQNDGAAPIVHRGGGVEAVTPQYFAAMGVPTRAGRVFNDSDTVGAAPVAVINDKLAATLWKDRSAVGQSLRLGAVDDPAAPVVTIVGVVGSIRRSAMHDSVIARVYLPYAQYPNGAITLTVRGRGDSAATSRAIDAAVRAVDPALMAEDVKTVDADLAAFVAPMRLITVLLGGFGLIGLLLAGLGVFGTMSYTITQRERELAVRSALGATPANILGLVIGSALTMTVAGIVPGIAAALLAAQTLRGFLFGITATDPVTFASVALFLIVVAMGACYRPARRAAAIDPIEVLRRN